MRVIRTSRGIWCPEVCAIAYMCALGMEVAANPQELTARDVLGALERSRQTIGRRQLEFEIVEYYAKGADRPLSLKPPASQALYRQDATLLIDGERYRATATFVETSDQMAAALGQTEVRTWDGTQARSLTSTTEGVVSGGIANFRTASYQKLPHFSWFGIPIDGELTTFVELLGMEAMKGPLPIDGGDVEWRGTFFDHTVTLRAGMADDQVYVKSVLLRYFVPAEPDRLLVAYEIYFDPPDPHIGLARSVSVVKRHPRQNPADSFWFLLKMQVTDARPVQIGHDTFRPQFATDTTVQDGRYVIAYTVGGQDLNLDGRLLSTHEPLHGDVGANLEWWIEHGELMPTGAGDDVSKGARVIAADNEANHSGYWFFGATIVLAILVVIGVRRKP